MLNVGIYIYPGAEVLDFSGPFEVFCTASRLASGCRPFNVFLVAETRDPVIARGGYCVVPTYGFGEHPRIDLLIVVGGVHTPELDKPGVIRWIETQAALARVVASVCTGAFLLAEAGVLTTQTVTTHWEDIAELRTRYPALCVVEQRRWVEEGRIISSGGISAGIDMSLQLVSRLSDRELAERTARQMEFDWVSST